ncbi:MAG: hypothetical protein ACFFAS_20480 [Promethearchaeota archaeon]
MKLFQLRGGHLREINDPEFSESDIIYFDDNNKITAWLGSKISDKELEMVKLIDQKVKIADYFKEGQNDSEFRMFLINNIKKPALKKISPSVVVSLVKLAIDKIRKKKELPTKASLKINFFFPKLKPEIIEILPLEKIALKFFPYPAHLETSKKLIKLILTSKSRDEISKNISKLECQSIGIYRNEQLNNLIITIQKDVLENLFKVINSKKYKNISRDSIDEDESRCSIKISCNRASLKQNDMILVKIKLTKEDIEEGKTFIEYTFFSRKVIEVYKKKSQGPIYGFIVIFEENNYFKLENNQDKIKFLKSCGMIKKKEYKKEIIYKIIFNGGSGEEARLRFIIIEIDEEVHNFLSNLISSQEEVDFNQKINRFLNNSLESPISPQLNFTFIKESSGECWKCLAIDTDEDIGWTGI